MTMSMNVLKRLFGRDDKFFDLLEASADEARHSATLLHEMLPIIADERAFQESIELLATSRRKHKRITQDITAEICRTFVTPLEREDIEALSSSLTRIPKTVEKIAERLLICPLNFHTESVAKLVNMLEQASGTVALMVHALRKKVHVEEIQDDYARLQTIEGDADRLMIALLRELFRGPGDSRETVFLKDIYELLEKAIDRCRDAGNVVFQVVLKYS